MNIKGTALKVIPKFIKDKFGKENFEKWLNSLDPEAKELYSGIILSSNWYSLDAMYLAPVQKMCDLFYNGDVKGALEAGAYDAENALSGMYKIFVRLGSPEFLIKRATVVFPTYYQGSAMDIISIGNGKAILRITKFGKMHKINNYTIKGWMVKALEISGSINPTVDVTKSIAEGDEYTEFVLNY